MSEINLNDAQIKAVEIVNGPALVVAGAGTGKTRVIVERIRKLIASGEEPSSILALTFTEKAAAEMQDRIAANDGLNVDTTVATFNRFGNDLLQRYGVEWGLGNMRLLGETGQLVYLREHFDELELDYFAPVSNPDGQLKLLADYLSKLKQQLVEPGQYLGFAKQLPDNDAAESLEKRKHLELVRMYERYQKMCRRDSVVDYDDQIYLTIQLLEARPNIRKLLQDKYRFILVDEFQDTNPMQSKLVDLLVGKDRNLMVVGDDDQSIYGWRGATLANILNFTVHYPSAQDITLIENYRSSKQILDAAYRLIRHNDPNRLEVMNQLDKRLRATQDDGPKPQVQHFGSLDSELYWLVDDIKKRIESGQAPSSIAVLTRRTALVLRVHDALEQANVAHVVAGISNDLYEQNAVRQLLEVLKTIADPLDNMALFHALSGPAFNIDVPALSLLSATARREHQSLSEAVAESDNDAAKAAHKTIELWRESASSQSVGSLAYSVIKDSGWMAKLYEEVEHNPAIVSEAQALNAFFKTLKEFERIAGVASVENYIASLPTLRSAETSFEDSSLQISDTQLNVLSVHRAKGLEWDTVYIVDCSEGSFPLRKQSSGLEVPVELRASSTEADEHTAEERRLMYVAVTRARRELILSHSDKHGGGATRKPSRFLSEMLDDFDTSAVSEPSNDIRLEQFAPLVVSAAATVLPPAMLDNRGHLTLNVSQISTWLKCPEDFRYKYVLNMPLPPAPQLTYGTLIHSVIERLHKARSEGTTPTFDDLKDYVMQGLPTAGYASQRSRERAHQQAEDTLRRVYDRFSVDSLPSESETPFRITLPNIDLTITGRIDAVYAVGDGVEIRDFKTGTSVNSPEKAKISATGSSQLTLYALAWRQLHDEMPSLLSLDFVETGFIGSVKKQPKSLDTLEVKLGEMVGNIRAGQYPPGPRHETCSHP